MSQRPDHLLDSRSRKLLRALISQYIQDGQPVGSRTLAEHAGLSISSATIRNVLADLEEIGLVSAPHTSAGRIPTARGYRLFVDSLLELQPMQQSVILRMQREMQSSDRTQEMLSQTSSLLSAATHFVGLVTVPHREQFAFKHIDFVALSDKRILVILVFTDNEVQNRVVETQRSYNASELEQIANYLNANFAGLNLEQVRRRLVHEMNDTKNAIDQMMGAAIHLAERAFAAESKSDVLVSGQTNLLGVQDLSDMVRLRELFDAFAHKQDLVALLEGCVHADGVKLFIGEESGVAPLDQCTVVAAPYVSDGQVLGVLGVIGPTRMQYARVIPLVQATAHLLGASLRGSHKG